MIFCLEGLVADRCFAKVCVLLGKTTYSLVFALQYHSLLKQFARIQASSLINVEKILNRPITKFYNGDDVNVIAAELRLTKTRPTSFYKKHNLL